MQSARQSGKTSMLTVAPDGDRELDKTAYEFAGEILRDGGLVAFPTETVYGLGANAFDDAACRRIYEAKQRPVDNPLIVHVLDAAMCTGFAPELLPMGQALVDAFWPGPLTIVVPHHGGLSDVVTAGLSTVAIRCPSHPVARRLLVHAGVPIAAPSANRSGRPSPSTAAHVREDLEGRVDAILDGGPTTHGLESTVVDISEGVPVLLRPGYVTREQLAVVIGPLLDAGESESMADSDLAPRSPGMKYRHYAPKGELWLVDVEDPDGLRPFVEKARRSGRRVGVIVGEDECQRCTEWADDVITYGNVGDMASVAANLYSALRECDTRGCEVVYTRTLPEKGLGHAVMNRLRKAAGGRVVTETEIGD